MNCNYTPTPLLLDRTCPSAQHAPSKFARFVGDVVRLVLLAAAGWAVAVVLAGAGVKVEPRGIAGPAHSLTRRHHMAVVDLLGVSVLQGQAASQAAAASLLRLFCARSCVQGLWQPVLLLCIATAWG